MATNAKFDATGAARSSIKRRYVPPKKGQGLINSISGPKQKTPYYVANPAAPKSTVAPITQSSSNRNSRKGTYVPATADTYARTAATAPKTTNTTTSTKSAPKTTSSVTSSKTVTSAPQTSTPTTSSPKPTTSTGTAGTVSKNPPKAFSGQGQSAGRGTPATNRKNPRRARSLTAEELKKLAARQLGI